MGAIVLIFGVPMIIASWLMSSTVLTLEHLHNIPLLLVITALVLPFAGWPALICIATTFAAPPSGMGRGEAVVKCWLGGAMLTTSILIMILAMSDSTTHPGPNPMIGYVVVGLDLSMLLSYGIWGGLSSLVPPDKLHNRALTTGIVLFAIGAGLVHFLFANDCPNCNKEIYSNNNMDDAYACQHRGGTYTDEGHMNDFRCERAHTAPDVRSSSYRRR